MKILIVSQYFWPETFRINEIVVSLVDRGFHVDILTGKPNYPKGKIFDGYRLGGCQRENYHGANIIRIPLIPRGMKSGVRLGLNYLSFIISGLLAGPWVLRHRNYDVIFVYGVSPLIQALPALFFGRLKRAPVVIWVQDLWPESLSATGYVHNRLILWCVEKVVSLIYRQADLLLVQSRAFIEFVRKLAFETPIKYYPNSVDESFVKPAATNIPDIQGIDTPFRVLFAGNIGYAQAVNVIVDAAVLLKKYTDIHFIMIGDGSCREWILQQVRQRELMNLHLPGRFPLETMPGFMRKASVLLVTLADQEIFAVTVPSKVQAYLAVGRPIIACMNGEGAQLVADARAGFVVPAEDGAGLADAVLRMYHLSETDRNKLAENAQAYYREHFDHENLVSDLVEHFEGVRRSK